MIIPNKWKISKKGTSIDAIVIAILIAMGIFFLVIIVGPYLNIQNCELSSASCANQRISFCFDWWMKDSSFATNQPKWKQTNMCERVEGEASFTPCPKPSKEECRELVRQENLE